MHIFVVEQWFIFIFLKTNSLSHAWIYKFGFSENECKLLLPNICFSVVPVAFGKIAMKPMSFSLKIWNILMHLLRSIFRHKHLTWYTIHISTYLHNIHFDSKYLCALPILANHWNSAVHRNEIFAAIWKLWLSFHLDFQGYKSIKQWNLHTSLFSKIWHNFEFSRQ